MSGATPFCAMPINSPVLMETKVKYEVVRFSPNSTLFRYKADRRSCSLSRISTEVSVASYSLFSLDIEALKAADALKSMCDELTTGQTAAQCITLKKSVR